MSESIVVRGGRVLDPGQGLDLVGDVLISDGRIAAVGPDAARGAQRVIDAGGLIVCPGFVDLHCHLREPGLEQKETIATGTLAAARGGFTTVCCMPNTQPPVDSAAVVEFIQRTARSQGHVRVLPIGCVTRGRAGKELAEMGDLADAGAVAFSDDGSPVADAALLRRALEYATTFGLPVVEHCEEQSLSHDGVMHEGWVSTRLGLRGIPAAAEETAVARAVALAELTSAHLHIAHVSTAGSVDMVRRAKERGAPVTAEVTPHHLALTHEAVMAGVGELPGGLAFDTNAKVNPPLRTPADAEACLRGLLDGTIDAIATDHAPHAIEDKLCEFDHAAFGISGLETTLGLCLSLVHEGRLDLSTLVYKLTAGPVKAFGLERVEAGLGSLAAGAPGDVVLIDPQAEWTVEPERFASKGKNTPLAGRRLRGRVVATVYGGKVAWEG
jgi:dihydroorotase